MVKAMILPVEAFSAEGCTWPSRFVSPEVLETLANAGANQIVTDNGNYPDLATIRLVVDIYRRKFRKSNPKKRLQVRILQNTKGWQWYARVIDRG